MGIPAETDSANLFTEFEPASAAAWRRAAVESLKGKPLSSLESRRFEGFTLDPLLAEEDIAHLAYLHALPGQFPYTRGTRAGGYQEQPWLVAQETMVADLTEFNAALQEGVTQGQTAVHLTFDKPTQAAQDPDHADPLQIGRGGLSVATATEFALALDRIDLTQQPLLMQPGAAVRPLMALLAAGQEDAVLTRMQGRILYDPLAILLRDGVLPAPLHTTYTELADLLHWRRQAAPHLRLLGALGTVYHDAGASAVQELAYTLAGAVAMIRALLAEGFTIAEIAPQFTFELGIGGDFFMEVAKLRAARLLWAHIVRAFGGEEEQQKLYIHGRSARRNKTMTDPHVNMLRVTTEAFAAVVGGVDSLHLDPYDAFNGATTPFSRRIARNVQLILQEEANLTRLIDPAGGAYLVESLTDKIGRHVWDLFQEIEARGGMSNICAQDIIQQEIAVTAAARQADFYKRISILVGANRYPAVEKSRSTTPDWSNIIADRMAATRVERKKELELMASGVPFPVLLSAARAGATLQQLCVEDEPLQVTPLVPYQPAGEIARLLAWAKRYQLRVGRPPLIFLAKIGPLKRHKPRADFIREFFAVGGFTFSETDGPAEATNAVTAAKATAATLFVICGHDDDYPLFVANFTHEIKMAVPAATVFLAGKPSAWESYRAAGVDEFVALGSNIVALNEFAQQQLMEDIHAPA